MKTVILRHVNLVDEAMYVLYQLANTENISEKAVSFASHFPKTEEAYRKKLDVIVAIYEAVQREIKCPKEKIEYYFKERTGFMLTYGALALVHRRTCYDYSLNQLEEKMKAYSIEDRVKIYADLLWDEGAENTLDDKLVTMEDLIAFLERSPLKKEECWEVIKIFNNQQSYFYEVLEMVTEVVALLKKNLKEIEKLEETFVMTWADYWEENQLVEFIQEKLGAKWKVSEEGCVIIPDLFLFSTVMISLKSRLQKEDVIRLGVLFDPEVRYSEQMISSERVVKFGKIISDKSKVEILKFINGKAAYGKEIAEALKLSTPTISYHVSALMEMGLIKTSVEANKIYYSINEEVIEQILDEIKRYFLTIKK